MSTIETIWTCKDCGRLMKFDNPDEPLPCLNCKAPAERLTPNFYAHFVIRVNEARPMFVMEAARD